jgi:membrane-bound metal-dependent hydrolase YbcI (DUF457 family)
MADFKTHITASTSLGLIYSTAAFYTYGVPLEHCLIAGGLCSASGMLPDLDSSSGIPQREMLAFLSVFVPMLMLPRFEAMYLKPEHMVLATGLLYLLIRFGVGGLFKRYAKHRGMWHSIPAALIAGMIAFLISFSGSTGIRIFKAWAVVMGFLSHLVLDEIYSVDWQGKKIRVKRSFGTALKLFGKKPSLNMLIYTKVIILAIMIASDEYLMDCYCGTGEQQTKSGFDWVLHYFHQHGQEFDHAAASETPDMFR